MHTRRRTRASQLLGKILVTCIGILFVLIAIRDVTLDIWGSSAAGVVTSIRRTGGERNESIPNRYMYSIGYRFTTADNVLMTNSYAKLGDAIYVKPDGTDVITIRYFAWSPQINAPEAETNLSLRQPLFVLIGAVLMRLAWRQQPARRRIDE